LIYRSRLGLSEAAPNVLYFVQDDVDFGQLSCFGGLVEMLVLDCQE